MQAMPVACSVLRTVRGAIAVHIACALPPFFTTVEEISHTQQHNNTGNNC